MVRKTKKLILPQLSARGGGAKESTKVILNWMTKETIMYNFEFVASSTRVIQRWYQLVLPLDVNVQSKQS